MGDRGLRVALRKLEREHPPPNLRILPERSAPYRAVAHVLRTISQLKYPANLGFTGEEKPNWS
jgi:hypothetical protein